MLEANIFLSLHHRITILLSRIVSYHIIIPYSKKLKSQVFYYNTQAQALAHITYYIIHTQRTHTQHLKTERQKKNIHLWKKKRTFIK